ncbi:unnamed protein product [Oikopleura dioica]|uniref:Uncharacterized protein n=1 Tax=Oikopleura dioica TaxID=34765 RepID=E4Y3Y7_OIKDI|nr:unnamed protein product [Oikopleura dioica]
MNICELNMFAAQITSVFIATFMQYFHKFSYDE